MSTRQSTCFLTAEWRRLVMVNYAIDPAILTPHVPAGTELDCWNDTVYASLVGFHFLNTRVRGVRIPFHVNFEEINLRFYVRRKHDDEWRRGVVFVKEIVPKPAIALVARRLYNENYVALPTRHTRESNGTLRVCYEWKFKGHWNRLEARTSGDPHPLAPGSEAQFIAEHYWGYSAQRNGRTKEYQVEHPSWQAWTALGSTVDVDVAGLYGDPFALALSQPPTSVFIADGSPVSVSKGATLA